MRGEISREAKCCQWYSRKAGKLRISPRVAGLKLRCLISYFLSCPRRPLRFSFQTTSVHDSSSNRKSQASPNLHCLNPMMSPWKKKNLDVSNLGVEGCAELREAITEKWNLVFSIQIWTKGKQIMINPNCLWILPVPEWQNLLLLYVNTAKLMILW